MQVGSPTRLPVAGCGELPHMRRPLRRMAVRFLTGTFRPFVTVDGASTIARPDDPAIFALNHNNYFESLAVPAAIVSLRGGRLVHFIVDWMFIHIPVIGWFIRQIEPVPVFTKPARWRIAESYRQRQLARSPVDECLRLLDSGASVGVFPEGRRNRDPGELLRGRPGIGRLILQSRAPVVPIGIEFPAARRLDRIPQVGRFVIRAGQPLDFTDERRRYNLRTSGTADARRSRRDAAQLGRLVVDRTMQAISELCGKRYAHGDGERRTVGNADLAASCHPGGS